MKIAILSFYSGVVYRGVETYVHELANRLAAKGLKVTVFQNGKISYKDVHYDVKTIGIKTGYLSNGVFAVIINQIADMFRVAVFTLRSLREVDKDVEIIVGTNNRLQALISRLWTVIYKKKLIIPGQGGPGLDERIALMFFPDVFVALTDFQKDWAKKVNPFVRIAKIANGVDIEKFSNPKAISLDLKKPIVICAAALWPQMKRQQLLIKAVSETNNLSLLLAGDGEGKNKLEKLGKKLLGKQFAVKSFSYDDMPEVYAGCDLFSFPTSSWEAFGVVLLEAMASGLPVVATDDPIRREIVGNAGLFVDPTDTNAYSKALSRALEINWGDKPRRQAEKFSWDKIAEQYEQLFFELANKK